VTRRPPGPSAGRAAASPPTVALIVGPCVTVGEDDLGAAQLRQLCVGVGGLAVDVVRRAELPDASGSLSLPPGDRGGAEPHPRRVLDAQVAEPAEAEDRDEVARPGTRCCAAR